MYQDPTGKCRTSQRCDISDFGKSLVLFGMSGSFFCFENCLFITAAPVISFVKGCNLESSTLDKPFPLPVCMKINQQNNVPF